jgi:hypothetical protein
MTRQRFTTPSDHHGDERCAAVFESIHFVIKGEKILKGAGLAADVVPIPREISSDCGMALVFACRDRDRVEQLFGGEGLKVVGLYGLRRGQYLKL